MSWTDNIRTICFIRYFDRDPLLVGRIVEAVSKAIDKPVTIELAFDSLKPKTVTGEVLKAAKVNAYNDFGKAPAVAPAALKDIKKSGGVWKVTLPAASVAVLEIK